MLTAALVCAALIGLGTQPLVIAALNRRQLFDRPNERSSHTEPIPRGGGIAVLLGILVTLLAVVGPPWAVIAGIFGMALLGLLDDLTGVPALLRLIVQLALGLTTGVALTLEFGVLALAPALAVAGWLVFYVNAFNFMDGVNGISALQAIAAGLVLAASGVVIDAHAVSGTALAVVGAGLGFLPFNLVRARVFLGDVGSYGLGAAIALTVVLAIQAGVPIWVAGATVAIYAIDVLRTVALRVWARQPLLVAHRWHIYQRLIAAGWSHLAVAATVGAASLGIGCCALLAWQTEAGVVDVLAGVAAAILALGYLLAPRLVGQRMTPAAGRPQSSRGTG